MADQVSRMDVSFSPFASGFCPADFNDFGTQLAARLIVTPGLGFSGINIGPVAPENTDLPWFNTTVNDWYYYSSVSGEWEPVDPVTVVGEVQIGTVLFWDGQISLIDAFWGDRWLFANGDAISRTTYSDYFGLVGTKWGPGDGATTFNIIDVKNYFLVGANQDDGGQAKTVVSDGATLTTQRAYEDHWHDSTPNDPAGVGGGYEVGDSFVGRAVKTTSVAGNHIVQRVLPPYKCAVPIVRVK